MSSQEKRCSTLLCRYGVDNVAKLPAVQEKRRETFDRKRDTFVCYQEPRVHLIDAASLQLYRLNKDVADEWLNTYHPFRAPRGNLLCLGLTDGQQIFCLMTFKRARNSKYVAELSRMWTLPTYNVVGGYDRLSSAASEFGLYNVVAYVNLSFENVKDYESIGMKYARSMQKTKWWIHDDDRMTDASRRQRHLSENELLSSGWRPIFDCGQRVYEFT